MPYQRHELTLPEVVEQLGFVARQLGREKGSVLNEQHGLAVMCAAQMLEAMSGVKAEHHPRAVWVDYTNHKGDRRWRLVVPAAGVPLYWGSTEHHPEPQWLLVVHDAEKDATRHFAAANIHAWQATRPTFGQIEDQAERNDPLPRRMAQVEPKACEDAERVRPAGVDSRHWPGALTREADEFEASRLNVELPLRRYGPNENPNAGVKFYALEDVEALEELTLRDLQPVLTPLTNDAPTAREFTKEEVARAAGVDAAAADRACASLSPQDVVRMAETFSATDRPDWARLIAKACSAWSNVRGGDGKIRDDLMNHAARCEVIAFTAVKEAIAEAGRRAPTSGA